MPYSEKIEQYKSGQLSAPERMAFEHELEDNDSLRTAYEAELLVEDLFTFTGTHLTDDQIIKPSTSNIDSTTKQTPWLAVLGFLFIGMLAVYTFVPSISSPIQSSPVVSPPIKQTVMPIVPEVIVPEVQETKEDIFIDFQEKETIPATIPSKKTIQKAPISSPKPIAAKPIKSQKSEEIKKPLAVATPSAGITLGPGFTVEKEQTFTASVADGTPKSSLGSEGAIESTEIVVKGASITFTAGKEIILKPGFHVEAGADFSASIEEQTEDKEITNGK